MKPEDLLVAYQLLEKDRKDRLKIQMRCSLFLVEMLTELSSYKKKHGETELYKKKSESLEAVELLWRLNMEMLTLNDQLHFQNELSVNNLNKLQRENDLLRQENQKLIKTIEGL
jgi:hypothetical protein